MCILTWVTKMLDVIHINKKWFNMSELTKSCYLADNKDDPLQTVWHTFHKLCFWQHLQDQAVMWDGKIGLWECVDYVAAK